MQENNIVLHIPNCNGIPIVISYGDKLPEKPKPKEVKK